MSDFTRTDILGDVAVVTVDNPPVNALGPGVLDAIVQAVTDAAARRDMSAIVLIGAGTNFIAGADIRMFQTIPTREAAMAACRPFHDLLLRIEDCEKPVVAAIRGSALGGGLEVAMACHYRVATSDARLGQPEVQLGLIPGAGGTQRLPRLVGVASAIGLCAEGAPLSTRRALADGLLDRVVEGDLLEGALAMARDVVADGPRRTRLLEHKGGSPDSAVAACAAARASVAKQAPGRRAPLAAVDAIEAGVTMGFERGSGREIELFADCVVSTESRALVHLFFAEREAGRVRSLPEGVQPREIRQAAVVGAGTMGAGIAMVYANAGIPVLLKEVSQEALDRGMKTVTSTYESAQAKGRLTQEECRRRLALIEPTTSFDRFGGVDLVVEAVFEDMALKKTLFAELARVTRPDCLLASNTSTLDIDEMARASGRPSRVVAHHFFSPAHVMKLLEIVRGRETSAETIATSMALARRLGKIGVLVGNCFGFVANRLLAFYRREALLLLEEGASAPQIDRALTDFGMPVGVFAMQDIAGLDIATRARDHLRALGRTPAPGPESKIPDRLVAMNRLGQKTGAGWYRYEAGSRKPIADPFVDELAAAAAAERGIVRHDIPDEEIIARIMTAIVNEGANVLDEGIAARAGDIDVIYCYGFGFPRHRGGPMFYGDTVGLPVLLDRIRGYRERFGDHWTPSPLIERLVAEGRGFYPQQFAVGG